MRILFIGQTVAVPPLLAYPILDVLRRRADRTIIENIMDILS
ncbi:hypothetical protein HMPREF0080_01021 [Anaeroglobus geminatus F0357]|uniref:Uncharacterized protein n=1 Tax=Anaeroglobus geminatus F0357 TaxID=861450 RepID=G9YH94_9FIRM|nr:hypothetical protein HMPREF0080_01021 [Anaeroglobus geminatus F0357]